MQNSHSLMELNMNKKMQVMLILSLCSSIAQAEICPSVIKIKQNTLDGWKIYDSEENKALSPQRLAKFKANVEKFALAEWSDKNNKNSTIHCYYLDKEGSNMEAFLTKDHFHPEHSLNNWYKVSGYVQCAAGKNRCKFHPPTFDNQLAKR